MVGKQVVGRRETFGEIACWLHGAGDAMVVWVERGQRERRYARLISEGEVNPYRKRNEMVPVGLQIW